MSLRQTSDMKKKLHKAINNWQPYALKKLSCHCHSKWHYEDGNQRV